ncbi:hypothetical protein GIB67_010686 [Kingdonia uniflora]|uniref:Multicopper oxidase n=1 Tax=Kingdonia uniflora TaxID=39325 RepID=A0A7J7MP25_9MAGN|nr:hypothetical protein GIB67_010686 [Kingdonia uniflora]
MIRQSRSILPLFFLIRFVLVVYGGATMPTVLLDWTVSSSQLSLLGVPKQVILINNQFPGPLLNLTTNDIVSVNVFNNLAEPFLLTWNGVELRRTSWQDGTQGTNCPIQPGQNWTYNFQLKDQIGSFFYFPSLLYQKAAGGYGPIRINNRDIIPIPFSTPLQEVDILIGDWYITDYQEMRASADRGYPFPTQPDGILINGFSPFEANYNFQPGATYRLRISNVGLKTSLNFRIQDHKLLLVEVEGSYTLKQYYDSLDIHVGQSYSVLVTANQMDGMSYYMVASSRFIFPEVTGVAVVRYSSSASSPLGPLPQGPQPFNYIYSVEQARSIRWDLAVGAARPNPQGSFHYDLINITRTIVLQNGVAIFHNRQRYTVNDISYVNPDTPLKLADYFQLQGVFTPDAISDVPEGRHPSLGISVIDVRYRNFIQVVFQNTLPSLQTWHVDGYNFFVVGMDFGIWDESRHSAYNMYDAVSRSTVQVYPSSWTAILMEMDNHGMWNVRSQDYERWYLGQELYFRVKGEGQDDPSTIPDRDEAPIPSNVIKCGRASFV